MNGKRARIELELCLADGLWHPILELYSKILLHIDPRVAARRAANMVRLRRRGSTADLALLETADGDAELYKKLAIQEAWQVVHDDLPKYIDLGRWQVMQCLLRDASVERRGPHSRVEGEVRRGPVNMLNAWRGMALPVVRSLCEQQQEFTTDDVWELLTENGIPDPPSRETISRLMDMAELQEWCGRTGRHVASRRPSSKQRKLVVWQGLLTESKVAQNS